MRPRLLLAAVTLLLTPCLIAQNQGQTIPLPNPYLTTDAAGKVKPRAEQADQDALRQQVQTFYLQNVPEPNDANEILTGLRLHLEPSVKMYLLPTDRAIVISAPPETLKLAGELIRQWDLPRHAYRLLFTINEFDGGNRIGSQHMTLDVMAGAHATLKNGSKIPVATGSYNPGIASGGANTGTETQFTYLDVGLNLDVTLDETAAGARLQCKFEQSSVVPEPRTIAGVDEPVIRQTVLQSSSLIAPGKAASLGTVDVYGSTRHLELEVAMTPIRQEQERSR